MAQNESKSPAEQPLKELKSNDMYIPQKIAWWVKAMKRNLNMSDLHSVWAHGTSLKSALLWGRSFGLVALAGMAVAPAQINGKQLWGNPLS